MLAPGDIGAVKGTGIAGWLLRHLIAPKTDRLHYFIVWHKVNLSGIDDYLILESLPSKGVTVGLLSWYDGCDVEFYRVDCECKLRHEAPLGLIKYARSKYDFLLIEKLILDALKLWIKILLTERRFRRLYPEEFTYSTDRSLICTEAVETAYLSVGVQIIDPGVVPLPSAFRAAELRGAIFKVERSPERVNLYQGRQ